jgi:oxygen-independent coproporphyrinogen-3 oxidase
MGRPFSHIDLDLLKKYDRPGPRYTSYPTAPLFSPSFTAEDFACEIRATNGPGATSDVSLYFHLPFCDTLCYFCGCTMLVTRDRSRIGEYLRYLKKEVDMVGGMMAPTRKVTQLHWGGGTPTHLLPDQLLEMGRYINDHFPVDPLAEKGVEIDPRELTRDHLAALREVGFNRMSMGVQDFNEQVQEAVNRIQPEALTMNAFRWARELGYTSINIDLIYGLPFQTVSSFERTVRKIIDIEPDRIAVFNYAHVPWMKPHQKLIHPEDLPSPDQKLAILKMTIELLTSNGYEYIGMDHFARPEDELTHAQKEKSLYRNFQGYSTRAGADLYGFGMSSISHFQNIYAQNFKTLPEYYRALDDGTFATHVGYRMTVDDHIRKFVIMRLMCDLELEKRTVETRYPLVFDEYFRSSLEALQQFVADGLVEVTSEKIAIVGAGRLLLRNIAMCFDAYLNTLSAGKPIFSRTV